MWLLRGSGSRGLLGGIMGELNMGYEMQNGLPGIFLCCPIVRWWVRWLGQFDYSAIDDFDRVLVGPVLDSRVVHLFRYANGHVAVALVGSNRSTRKSFVVDDERWGDLRKNESHKGRRRQRGIEREREGERVLISSTIYHLKEILLFIYGHFVS